MMRLVLLAVATAAALVGVAGCGDSFSTGNGDGGGSDSGLSVDSTSPADGGDVGAQDSPLESGAPGEGSASDGGVAGIGLTCGTEGKTCSGSTPVCCLGSVPPACARIQCGCATQLTCASDLDCQGLTPYCCIASRQDADCDAGAGHFVSACAAACTGNSHLCSPDSGSTQCLVGRSCSSSSSDLQNVGLPPGDVYGVCSN